MARCEGRRGNDMSGHQVSNGSVYSLGGACFSSRGKAGSKQAQLGALEVQIVI